MTERAIQEMLRSQEAGELPEEDTKLALDRLRIAASMIETSQKKKFGW